ncbi:MAG: TRAP transporter small permease [Sediminispirochaetaceae bacterium]
MNRLFEKMDRGLILFCMFLTGILALTIIFTVFLRYVFGITFVWAEEVITYLFIGTTFFGAALVTKENEHISIPALLEALPRTPRKVLSVFGLIVSIIVVLFLLSKSLIWIEKAGKLVTPGLRVPERIFYYMVPISCVLMIFYSLRQIFAVIRNSQDTEKE